MGAADGTPIVPHGIFSDQMVLQSGRRIPFRGTGPAGSPIRVTAGPYTGETTAALDGQWRVELGPFEAGGPMDVVMEAATTRTLLRDVLVGEVWLCSGQSNMEWPMWATDRANEAIAEAVHPRIRLFTVARTPTGRPQADVVPKHQWVPCSPDSVRDFSAVAYYFARELQRVRGVPIGVVSAARGGSPAECWLSAESLALIPDFAEEASALRRTGGEDDALIADYERRRDEWNALVRTLDAGYEDNEPVWATTDLSDDEWSTMPVPSIWQREGLPEFNGIMWFRRTAEVPDHFSETTTVLLLGAIDDCDDAFVNGEWVGSTEGAGAIRAYVLPPGKVRAGRNSITVRVLDYGGEGGFRGGEHRFAIETTGTAQVTSVPLAGEWRYRIGPSMAQIPQARPVSPRLGMLPTALYNGMIVPVREFPFAGILWYQGESNVGRAAQYRALFPAVIEDWRALLGEPRIPFLYVQLAAFGQPFTSGRRAPAAELREAQAGALRLPATAMVTAVDVGNCADIHPRDKLTVGLRLARAARVIAYGEKLPIAGPRLRRADRRGRAMVVSFEGVTTGLTVRGSGLRGFSVAGTDQVFYAAEARLASGQVVAFSPNVSRPLAVRYNWADCPDGNLYDGNDLPVLPFRSDDWEY